MTPPPKLSFACPLPWQDMSGDERSRFCRQCGHSVQNLSMLNREERRALQARAGRERVCGTYYLRLSGEMVTPDRPLTDSERSRLRQFGVAALSASALALAAGCVSPSPAPQPPPATSSTSAADTTPGAGITGAKPDEDTIVLLTGLIICEPPPPAASKPGPASKRW